MKDPVLDKLKTDAGEVLGELWRLLRHQPPVEEWPHSRLNSPVPSQTVSPPKPPAQSGLCYFHLN